MSLHKIGLVSGGTGGLSIGREGPTVLVGVGAMVSARRLLSPQSGIAAHDLMVAGAAAGIAVAVKTPLGGLVAMAVFANETYFGRLRVQPCPGRCCCAVCWWRSCGRAERRALCTPDRCLGARAARPVSHWRAAHPLRVAARCGFAVAVIGLTTHGVTVGAGYLTRAARCWKDRVNCPVSTRV